MDIGRIGRYLASWRFGFHLSLSFAAVHTVLAVMDFHAAYLAGITFHAGIALMCKFLEFYDRPALRACLFRDGVKTQTDASRY